MVDVANFAARNFGFGPDLAQIDLARNRNALAQQELQMGPLRQQYMQQQIDTGQANENRINQQEAAAAESQKHQFFYSASKHLQQHPESWPAVVQEAKNRKYLPQDFNEAYDPQKIQQYVDQYEIAGLGASPEKLTMVPQGATALDANNQPVFTNPAAPSRGENSRFGSPQIMESGKVAVLDRATGRLQYSDNGQPVDPKDKASANLQIVTLPDGSQQIVDKRFGLGAGAGMAGQPPGAAPPPRSAGLVSPETALAGQFAKSAAEKGGAAQGEAAAALPDTLGDIQFFRGNIEGLMKAPAFDTIYGLSGVTNPKNYIPGTDAMNAQAMRRQLSAQAFGVAIQKMRGLGQLSNSEGLKVTDAFTRAANPKISAPEAKQAWGEVLGYLDLAEQRAKTKAGKGAPNPANPATQQGAPQAAQPAMPDFSQMSDDQLKAFINGQ